MSESDLNYISKSILNVMPDAIDLSKEIKYSSYVQRREYVEVFPTTQPPTKITSANIGTAVRINLADPGRWLDKRSGTLQMDIGGITPTNPTTDLGNFAVLDGPCSMLNRCNVYVGGQQINGGSINNLNKVAAAVQMNNGSVSTYCSDESALLGGCDKLKYVLNDGDAPESGIFYETVANSPYNLLPGGAGGVAGSDTLVDALGF